ncbi:MAG: hypothetical protein M3N48_01285 [Verrucomicrobiota bacterium]|nr:hypothetical protein [Verrucomicrobiota bacterium]
MPAIASGGVICVGLLVLIGWTLDLESLKRIVPGFMAMNPATAVLFILTGIALASALRSRSLVTGVMGKVLSAIVVVAAALEFLEFLGICRSPIDEVLFAAKLSAVQDVLPNRMAPNTALNFFLAGLSILLLDTRGRRSFGQVLAVLIGFGAILSITGYGYGVRSFRGLAPIIPTALHTAITFLFLAAGIFFAVPRAPLPEPFATNDPGEVLARILRILFPLAVLLTLFLGGCACGANATNFMKPRLESPSTP